MFKLKIAKERKKNQEIENDLRGLNHDQLIQSTKPYAFMAVKNFDKKIIHEVSEIFKLSVQQTLKSEWILVAQNKSENFKEDIIKLCAAGIALAKLDSKSSSFIGISQLLRALLMQADKAQKDLSMGERLEINDCEYQNAVLTLSPSVQRTLKQSGIHCVVSDGNRMLDKTDIEHLLNQFILAEKKAKLMKVV